MNLVLIVAIAWGLLAASLPSLVYRGKIRDFDGRLIPAPTDIDRLLKRLHRSYRVARPHQRAPRPVAARCCPSPGPPSR